MKINADISIVNEADSLAQKLGDKPSERKIRLAIAELADYIIRQRFEPDIADLERIRDDFPVDSTGWQLRDTQVRRQRARCEEAINGVTAFKKATEPKRLRRSRHDAIIDVQASCSPYCSASAAVTARDALFAAKEAIELARRRQAQQARRAKHRALQLQNQDPLL